MSRNTINLVSIAPNLWAVVKEVDAYGEYLYHCKRAGYTDIVSRSHYIQRNDEKVTSYWNFHSKCFVPNSRPEYIRTYCCVSLRGRAEKVYERERCDLERKALLNAPLNPEIVKTFSFGRESL